ncbi:diaminopimelate decarboxylase [Mesorhizobium sp. VK24D]|uniref:Diaminopimelate decarboxylase n=1 Tax=Mesorhizobium album TaxID=3072314 RepID=A0ABU4XYU7_9HYPH|nr:diaminopimelate decarboxylase [Mesorhizobium sp. VK24D]MDX8479864.1 diaminopimelate decarboxylase [Mesorhizobium sp. VK24D]
MTIANFDGIDAPKRLQTPEEKNLAEKGGFLQVEDVDLRELCELVGTPAYVYSSTAIVDAYRSFEDAFGRNRIAICFAVKANSNLSILSLLRSLGSGMDIVSGGELARALSAGVPGERIVFSGVGKTAAEIRQALDARIHQFNVESAAELQLIAALAAERKVRAPVSLRVNPDVDALTHAKISTGRKGDKFGIAMEDVARLYADAAADARLDPVGLAVHIGSQITELSPYQSAYSRLRGLVGELRAAGLPIRRLDLGGGLGISYGGNTSAPSLAAYADIVCRTVGDLGLELTIEPGRRIVGEAGVLVTEVLTVKHGEDADIVIIDAGMNDLARPALYGAVHPVSLLVGRPGLKRPCRIFGPVCESADFFGCYADLPPLMQGDRLVLHAAGAYGASMASNYNTRPLAPEVLVKGDSYAVVRRRQSIADMLVLEKDAGWFAASGRRKGDALSGIVSR